MTIALGAVPGRELSFDLILRSRAQRGVSKDGCTEFAAILRDARKSALLRMRCEGFTGARGMTAERASIRRNAA
jgi:hypothetical protein